MKKSHTKRTQHVPGAANLAGVGMTLRELDVLAPVRDLIQIEQKIMKETPFDKQHEAFISILAGAGGLVDINTYLRAGLTVQAACGRSRYAEHAVVQETLLACTATHVVQVEHALDQLSQHNSQGYRHDACQAFQILDVDRTGMPCGPKADSTHQHNRRGCQRGRVLPTRSAEVVVDRPFEGRTTWHEACVPLVQAAEQTLERSLAKRARTLLRVDDGHWARSPGSPFLGTDSSGQRARRPARTVVTWMGDPRGPGRPVGWVEESAHESVREVQRIAIRKRQAQGQWVIVVLISTLPTEGPGAWSNQPMASSLDPQAFLLALLHLSDPRGGGVETAFTGEKQGLGLSGRSSKRFEVQQMVMFLEGLAQNVINWACTWWSQPASPLQRSGMMRMVRDVFPLCVFLLLDAWGRMRQMVLSLLAPFASVLLTPFQELFAPVHVIIRLAQT